MQDFRDRRNLMVQTQIAARGVGDSRVLDAMRGVPRERFVAGDLAECAYEDTPLPIAEGQTISQPYIVAAMAAALELCASDRVLEIGTGSGYAAAVLAHLAAEIYTIERHDALAERARYRLTALGYANVHVRTGDGTRGWPEQAPYDAIVVAAGGPEVPPALAAQLVVGGRLVMPVGTTPRLQTLIRVRRTGPDAYARETLGECRFVPLVGAEGWREAEPDLLRATPPASASATVGRLIGEASAPITDADDTELDTLLEHIGGTRVGPVPSPPRVSGTTRCR